MITIDHIKIPQIVRLVGMTAVAPDFWRASCLCGWSGDVGWQSDAEELGRDHLREANCEW